MSSTLVGASAFVAMNLVWGVAAESARFVDSQESPVAPSPLDADWLEDFNRADLLFSPNGRPDFEKLPPIENCTGCAPGHRGVCRNRDHVKDSTCPALWHPGLGNGFLGSIAQSPTLHISGFFSGDYGRYTAGKTIPPQPTDGFSNKQFAYRARIPAYSSSIIVGGDALLSNSSRIALNTREAVYYERSSLSSGGTLQITTYFHRTRRNLIVVEVELDCTRCKMNSTLSMRAFSGDPPEDVIFSEQQKGSTPRQLLGRLRSREINGPSTADLYDTDYR